MASIRKNPNGTWSAEVYIGRDSKGKKLREFVTCDTKKECLAAARELESDVANKSLNNLSKMKMNVYMDKWLENNKPFLSSTTVKGYKMYIEHHFKPAFENKKVCEITDMDIKEYMAKKLTDEKLSPTTVRKHFFTLSKIFHDALKSKSPCIDLKPPQNSEFKPKIPTEDEFETIVDKFRHMGLEEEIIILLAGWCGLRRGEIFALKWNDIDETNDFIKIDEAVALEEIGYKFGFKDPKSHNGIRQIVAPDYLMNLIKDLKKIRLKPYIKNNDVLELNNIKDTDIKDDPIFTYNPHTFTKIYSKIISNPENKLPKVRFHDLRHYHASLLYKNKVPDLYAAERLGHDIWVLKKIYQHLGLEEKKEIDEKVKSIFKKD